MSYLLLVPSESAKVGIVMFQPPAKVRRMQVVMVEWEGGYAGCDLSRLILQKKNVDGQFEDFLTPAGEPYSDDTFTTLMLYIGNYPYKPAEDVYSSAFDHRWRLEWEERIDFLLGIYRFIITGTYYDGGAEREYQVVIDEFELLPRDDVAIRDVKVDGSQVTVMLNYLFSATNDDGYLFFE